MLLILLQSQAGATTHDTSGAIAGAGAVVTGSASRKTVHATTGALAGPGASVSGSAARTRAHASTGALTGQSSVIAGAANRFRAHATTGALNAGNAIIVGSAARTGAAVTHSTSGVLAGQNAIIVGIAQRSAEVEAQRGEGWIPQLKRKRRFAEERDEREQLRKIIEAAVDPVTEKQAKVVTVNGEVAVVTESQAIPLPVPPTFDAQAVARLAVSVLEAQGIEAQRVRDVKARQQARIALEAMRRKIIKRRREEEILLLM